MAIEVNPQPHITVWNRLEGRNRETEFDRSLKAEIRDPLWMLTRQWQFGEFQAEDTGSAVFAQLKLKSTHLTQYSQRGMEAMPLDTHLPLEAQVEREKIPTEFDLSLRLEMGQHLLRMVKKELSDAEDYTDFKDQLTLVPGVAFEIPTDSEWKARLDSNPEAQKVMTLMIRGNGTDGGFVYRYLTDGNTLSDLVSESGSMAAMLDTAGEKFVDWFHRTYYQPSSPADTAWNSSHLEYQFACSAPTSTGENAIVSADEYYQGHLDWYNFDYETNPARIPSSLESTSSEEVVTEEEFTVLTSTIRFPGMPNSRWWEMEDAYVDLGDIRMGTTELGKAIFTEFGLIYSNDWLMVPYDLPAGSLCEIEEIIITDGFGQRTSVSVAETHEDEAWDGWRFFRLGNRNLGNPAKDAQLFLPPGIYDLQESAAIEAVNFIRDDMANMVWAIETTVPDDLGKGIDGFEAGSKYRQSLETQTPTTVEPPNVNIAKLQYRLATEVPENWIPFIPVRKGELGSRDTQLQRASMPRIIPGTDPKRIRPRTSLLRQGFDENGIPSVPYLVFEEEVPRSGVVIKQTWQRTRTENGTVVVWQGRRKHTGRIATSSGLQFDQIVPKKSNAESES